MYKQAMEQGTGSSLNLPSAFSQFVAKWPRGHTYSADCRDMEQWVYEGDTQCTSGCKNNMPITGMQ